MPLRGLTVIFIMVQWISTYRSLWSRMSACKSQAHKCTNSYPAISMGMDSNELGSTSTGHDSAENGNKVTLGEMDRVDSRSDSDKPQTKSRFPFTHDMLPDETLYILDGTSMLFIGHYSKENRRMHSRKAFLTPSLSESIMKTLHAGQQRELVLLHRQNKEEEEGLGDFDYVDEDAELTLSCAALTTMVYQFVRFVRDVRPRYIAVAFDSRTNGSTFRKEMYPDYKKSRKQSPVQLAPQFHLAPHVMEAFGCRCVMQEGYEADDLMASLGTWARDRGLNVVHVSGDKDMMQMVDYGVHVMLPFGRQLLGKEEVIAKTDVQPSAFIDFQALSGDRVDDIPGVPGIGIKTAASLLNYFKSIPNMVQELGLVDVERPSDEEDFLSEPRSQKSTKEYYRQELRKAMGKDEHEKAVNKMTEALIGTRANPETTLAIIYGCGVEKLMFYRDLVTLRSNLTVSDMLLPNPFSGLSSNSNSSIKSSNSDSNSTSSDYEAAAGSGPAEWSVTTSYFRYRGEAGTVGAAEAGATAAGTRHNPRHVELLLEAISPSLVKPLKYLRTQYYKLDRS